MSTKQQTIDLILEKIAGAGKVSARKMFGEYAIYCDGKVVALVCDEQLFIKPTDISNEYLDNSYLAPPYEGAKNYYCVPEDRLEEKEWLSEFISKTASRLPLPKIKKSKKES